ncbi:helix-turn-helix transcriptional regulator [Micromonospora sp. ATA32]|nr:helix-turn-helix transcriptional regulator [Micromonospora sp. ATA32]
MTPEQVRRARAMRRLAAQGKARELRRAHDLSLRELAVIIGTTASTLSRWETGLAKPRVTSAVRWADALEITPERAA